jgi:dTDP-4-amino-4,6-dideoxy-D-glucose transaminase
MSRVPIYVTQPYLPPLEEVLPLLERIWETRILTNHGPFHEQLQETLADYFDSPYISLVTNGMIALQCALEAAELEGEVITTPFSFVATTHAIRRANLTPVFVDIREEDLNIDPALIEAAITERTSAIVAVHCYGNPCQMVELDRIASRHNLKLIYDAAHAFGVTWSGRSLVSYGDFSTLSFHATKTFNTFEGGAVISASAAGKERIDELRNFGIRDEVTVASIGGNAKMSEFNAALGLIQLRHVGEMIEARGRIDARYRSAFAGAPGIRTLTGIEGTKPNFSYFPILVTEEYRESRDQLYERLKAAGIYGRRYFYPLLASLPMYRDLPSATPENLPKAIRAAEQVLCLPIYPGLSQEDQGRIIAEVIGP